MKKDTKEIILAIFVVGWVILAVLGYWYVGFIFLILYLFLPKSREVKAEHLRFQLISHLFQKRNWENKKEVKKQLKKELGEMAQTAEEIEEDV